MSHPELGLFEIARCDSFDILDANPFDFNTDSMTHHCSSFDSGQDSLAMGGRGAQSDAFPALHGRFKVRPRSTRRFLAFYVHIDPILGFAVGCVVLFGVMNRVCP